MESFEVRHVLLVEDDPASQILACEAFEPSAHVELAIVEDGEAALQHLRDALEYSTRLPDLVLLDLNLPGRSGQEVLVEIKGHPVLHRIPVVILSCSSSSDDVDRAYDHHANAFVTKSIDFDTFATHIAGIAAFFLQTVRLPNLDGDGRATTRPGIGDGRAR